MASDSFVPNIEGYVIAEKLGSGSYGEVFKAFKKEGKKDVVAIKCVTLSKLSQTARESILSEIEILKKMSHENIVKLKDFTWDSIHIYLIMEYCSGGNLYSYIHKRQRLSENICKRFLQQLVYALHYLREKNISHFDLKPQNIFLASKKLQILKIGDFGLAQYISDDDKSSLIKGSPLYMAPEIVLKGEHDAKADIWSVGIILYECLFGKAPYSSKTFEELINKIKDDSPIEIPLCASISFDCREFLHKCLEREPSKRFDFVAFFNHPFVDLEHAPQSDSLKKTSLLLAKAIGEEEMGNSHEAFSNYNEALKYLIPVLQVENDATKRTSLRKKINSYVKRMESIKSDMKNGESEGLNIIEIPLVVMSPSEISQNGPALRELLQLAKTTPMMITAIEIAQSGELYERESNYSLALEKYELALGKLLSLLQGEPKGRRRELLLEETNRWMERAETVKALKESINNQDDLSIAETEKTCSIQ